MCLQGFTVLHYFQHHISLPVMVSANISGRLHANRLKVSPWSGLLQTAGQSHCHLSCYISRYVEIKSLQRGQSVLLLGPPCSLEWSLVTSIILYSFIFSCRIQIPSCYIIGRQTPRENKVLLNPSIQNFPHSLLSSFIFPLFNLRGTR
jgi:hypothetical protein